MRTLGIILIFAALLAGCVPSAPGQGRTVYEITSQQGGEPFSAETLLRNKSGVTLTITFSMPDRFNPTSREVVLSPDDETTVKKGEVAGWVPQ